MYPERYILKVHIEHPLGWLLSKKREREGGWGEKTSVGKGLEKPEPLSFVYGMNVKWYSYYGRVWKLLKTLSTELPYGPVGPLLQYKRIKSRVLKIYLNTHVHSSIVYNTHKVEETECALTDEWIIKMLNKC